MVRDKDNRGREPRKRLSKEEQIIKKKRIEERNKALRKQGQKRISANDPRRSVGDLTEEEIIRREIIRQRKLYEESLDNELFDDELEENFDYEDNRNANNTNNTNNEVKKSRARREKNKKNIKKKKKKINIKTIFKIIGVLLLLFIGITFFRVFSTISKITNTDMISPKVVDMDSTVNILLLGMDVGNIKNPKDTSSKRTDTIMVLNFNPKTEAVKLVSVPRDTMIDINGRRWKINAAYPIGGEEEIVKQVEKLLKIDVNYVANINYTAFRDFIDAIGGVTVNIKHNMDYTDKSQNLRIKFKKGTTEHLDGKKSEEFFRWRKNNDGTGLAMGDLGRIENQHEFIQAVIKKCTSPTIAFKLPNILKVVEKNVSTNMPGMTMVKYATKLMFVNSDDFQMVTIKGTPEMIGGQSYYVFSEEKNKALIKSLQDGSEKVVSKGNIKVKIINSTTVTGLAARYKTTLDREGFKVVDTGSIENNPAKKSYAMVKNKEIEKIVKKDLVGIDEYKTMKKDSEYSDYDLVVVLGLDSTN